MRMLIEDKSVTVPLTIFCGLVSAFVLLMYIMVPFWRDVHPSGAGITA